MNFCTLCGHANPAGARLCSRCQAPFAGVSDELQVGEELSEGRYVVQSTLGRGGMGSVYRAEDRRLDRDVALKRLHPSLTDHPTARQRLEREARALARVNHSNVVDIFDVFEHGRSLILVLEYVEGGTLSERLRAGVMPWPEALRIMDGILAGLQALHAKSLIHRDVKPDNILMDLKEDTPKLSDLGVARDVVTPGMTRLGARLGTPEYMSPEQVMGERAQPASDLYACGVLLYEMLSGELPFSFEDEVELYHAHVKRAPSLDALPQSLPPALAQSVGYALAKAPEERPPSAKAMRRMLADIQAKARAPKPRGARRSVPTTATPLVSRKLIKKRPLRPTKIDSPLLVVMVGNDVGASFRIDTERVLVGRSLECDISLDDPALSRRHFALQRSDEGYRLIDLQSRNGTAVEGQRCKEVTLREGMVIQVGSTQLIWRV